MLVQASSMVYLLLDMVPLRNPWRLCKGWVRRMDLGETFDRSDDWVRQVQRIAMLPREIGEAVDELGLCFSRARYVAYGVTNVEQRHRLEEERQRIAAAAHPVAPSPSAQRLPLVKEVPIPRGLRHAREEDLEAYAAAVLRTHAKRANSDEAAPSRRGLRAGRPEQARRKVA